MIQDVTIFDNQLVTLSVKVLEKFRVDGLNLNRFTENEKRKEMLLMEYPRFENNQNMDLGYVQLCLEYYAAHQDPSYKVGFEPIKPDGLEVTTISHGQVTRKFKLVVTSIN